MTIFGESAGGFSCATLTATRFSGQLFHRAIFQSGCMQTGITKVRASVGRIRMRSTDGRVLTFLTCLERFQEDMGWLVQAFADALEVPALSLETVGNAKPEALLAAQNKVHRVLIQSD